jgi:hypothetical protein
MLKKLLAKCLVLFLILPLMSSCSAENSSETILVPGTANMVVKVQVGRILNNTTFQTAYDELAKKNPELPQTLNEVLNQLAQKTGFDFSSISTAVFFSDIESTSPKQNTYSGMIASGTFNESTLIAKIEQETQQKLTTSDYKGLKVYAGAQNKFEMVFLSQSQLAFGTPQAIRDVVDVSKRDKPALNQSIIETLNRLSPALIVGASVPPESVLNQFGKEVPVPQQTPLALNSFQDIDNIGFSIDQPSISLSVRLDLHFSNATSAQDAKDTITGFILVAKGTSQNANVKTALGNIQLSMTDSWLSIRDIVTPADIGNLTGSMQTQK